MKLFISYRRKTWAFAQQLLEKLQLYISDEIFMDLHGVDDADFEKAILGHLRSSHAVLLIVTEHTFADRIHNDADWVRKEISEALIHKIPIVLICENGLLPPHGLPEDIKDVAKSQGINFYPEFFMPAIERLADFLVKMRVATRKSQHTIDEALKGQAETNPFEQQRNAFIEDAMPLIESDELEKVEKGIFILEELFKTGYKSRMMEKVLSEAITHRNMLTTERTARDEYEEIRIAISFRRTEKVALEEFADWTKRYPLLVEKLDVDNLRERASKIITPQKPKIILPQPFDWCYIPQGKVTLTHIREGYLREPTTFDVAPFWMSKYPITNAHYGEYVKDGGKKPRYWDDSKWNGANQPVVGVSWYDAMAFCAWLSKKMGTNVLLPTEQQWQWAAQGNDGRDYPWGNGFDTSRCNTSESGIGKTTPVTQYEGKGDSPFGVVDMSGNVWHWCLTDYENGNNDGKAGRAHVLRGGSWNSGSGFARASFRGDNDPDNRNSKFGFFVACRPY